MFRNAAVGEVVTTAGELGLAAVQLHGDEDVDYLRALRRDLPARCDVWQAVPVDRHAPQRCADADRLLFDSGSGGTGRTFDWGLVKNHPDLPRALIAGGIGPANAGAAMALGAYAIDVGSAVDARPGVKSVGKIRALFETLRPAARHEIRQCA